uniref:Uncharacterized protein n=1 Tax=Arundo donax TaxID=35708 RepID=A0A0A9ENG5_ARUDO
MIAWLSSFVAIGRTMTKFVGNISRYRSLFLTKLVLIYCHHCNAIHLFRTLVSFRNKECMMFTTAGVSLALFP